MEAKVQKQTSINLRLEEAVKILDARSIKTATLKTT